MGEYPADQVSGPEPGVASADVAVAPVVLTPLAQQHLDGTRPWVRFMSIVTLGAAGLVFLVGIAAGAVAVFGGLATRGESSVVASAVGATLIALLYLVLAGVYVVPGVFLARYASAIRTLEKTLDPAALEDALRYQKSFWRFVGILTALSLVLAAIGLVVAVAIGVIAAGMAARS